MADANLKIDTTLLDGLIVGRVEPHIYAFSTETVPNYLKVGDTARGVRVRLDEWRKIFPNLIQKYEHSPGFCCPYLSGTGKRQNTVAAGYVWASALLFKGVL